jgi:hypothetical protein
MTSGKLTKMNIRAFSDPEFNSSLGAFTLQINPESYNISVQTISTPDSVTMKLGRSTVPDYKNLNFSFFLDSTGVIPGCKNVAKSIKEFNTLCLDINGDSHTSNYLKILWKDIAFRCKLETLDIKYLMFSQNGSPIRAELTVKFKEFIDASTEEKRANKNSPDMTHIKTIVDGDSLPSLCNEIYGDSKYYLQIAEINNLINFRYLSPGQKIVFPRMQK